MTERIDQILEFIKEIDKFKEVEREIFLKNRKESDAEHAWHLAMFILLFEKDLPKGLDFTKMFKLALMHDLVEIYAGDTWFFDKEGRKTKKDREMKAAKNLFSKLPKDLEEDFHRLFQEWENSETKESKIVHSFDKIQPMIQNILSEGKSWKGPGITYEDIDLGKKKFFEHDKLMKEIYDKVMKEIREIV